MEIAILADLQVDLSHTESIPHLPSIPTPSEASRNNTSTKLGTQFISAYCVNSVFSEFRYNHLR